MGKVEKKGERRRTGIGWRVKSLGSSAVVKRDVVPEHRVCGGSDLLSLFGRERSQKGLQLVGEEPGRRRTLRPLLKG